MAQRDSTTRRRYLKGVGVTGVAGMAALGGCLQQGGTETEVSISGPIQMGSILPISGALSAYGSGMQAAVELAVEDVNNAGGVRGADINLTTRDSETNPDAAVNKYNNLVSNQDIVGFVGAASSGVSTTIAQNIADDQVMEVSNASTSPVLATLGYGNVGGDELKFFARTSPNDGQQGLVMGRIMNQRIEADTASFIYVGNAYGEGLAQKASEAFDGETLASVGYDKRSQDYTSVLDSAHEGDPDAIGFVGYPENGQTILQQWNDGSYNTSASDWVLSEGLNSDDFLTGNSSIVSDMWVSSPDPEQTDGASTFQERIGEENTLFAPHAYDAMILMALAMQKAGEASGPAIARNIRSISRGGESVTVGEMEDALSKIADGTDVNYQGASSPVNLNENLEPLNAFAILRINDDGSRETVEQIDRSFFQGKL